MACIYMKQAVTYWTVLVSSALVFSLFSGFAHGETAKEAAEGLIQRVSSKHAKYFVVDTSHPRMDGKDTFSVSDTSDGKILLAGNNGVSVASALNWYIKNRAFCHVSWCGDQLNIPTPLPKVGEKVTISTLHKDRVFFNYCTLSYTAAFWDWERWQREIDFVATNGINAPLSVTGLEGVWYHTLLEYGFSDREAREFLVGPGFLAWQWIANIEGHAGPLPKARIDSHIEMGKKICDREMSLGMIPIQQGFTGYVPRLLKEKYPDASTNISRPASRTAPSIRRQACRCVRCPLLCEANVKEFHQ